jgi:dihydropteroate synthase
VQNTAFSTNKTLNVRGRLLDLSVPRIMGILNVTPDSFYDGGKFVLESEILDQVTVMLASGADIVDVGGYSSRPGATHISVTEETDRVKSAIRIIMRNFPDAIVSVDTFRSPVARAAIGEGAAMVNDISGGELDGEMFSTVAQLRVPYVLMHMKGTPQTMATLAHYENLVDDLLTYFHKKIFALADSGVTDVIVDPGFGFAKTREQNFAILNQLDQLTMTGKPVMVGLSRKSMIWKTLGTTAEHALNGTTALHMAALLKGAALLRVHDVKEAVEVVKLLQALRHAGAGEKKNANGN